MWDVSASCEGCRATGSSVGLTAVPQSGGPALDAPQLPAQEEEAKSECMYNL